MAAIGKVAKRYAKSLLDLALEQKLEEKINTDMLMLQSLCDSNRDFTAFLTSPIIQSRKKLKVFDAIFQGNIEKMSLEFMKLLIKNKREGMLEEISLGYIEQLKKQKGILDVFVESVQPLEDNTIKLITEKIKKHFEGTIEIYESTNPELLGGFVVMVEDKQIDASIKTQLANLKNILLN
ncbi:MAG: ATP synthase F1 subunit delta [Crocinitomicaceae bacterium]